MHTVRKMLARSSFASIIAFSLICSASNLRNCTLSSVRPISISCRFLFKYFNCPIADDSDRCCACTVRKKHSVGNLISKLVSKKIFFALK